MAPADVAVSHQPQGGPHLLQSVVDLAARFPSGRLLLHQHRARGGPVNRLGAGRRDLQPGQPPELVGLALGLTSLRSLHGLLPGFTARISGAVPAYAFLLMVIAFFFYFYPLWTGLPLTADALNGHIWFAFVKPWPNWCLCYWTNPG